MNNLQESVSGSFCLSAPVVAEGTNANTFKTTNTTVFVIDGRIYSKAATDNVAFTTGASQNLVDGQVGIYGVYLDASLNFSTALAGAVSRHAVLAKTAGIPVPQAKEGKALIGWIRVSCEGAAFTPGTTDLSAANIVESYADLFAPVSRPLSA